MTMPLLRVGAPRRETSHAAPADAITRQAFSEALLALAALPSPNSEEFARALRRWAAACLEPGERDGLACLSEADRSLLQGRLGSRLAAMNSLAAETDPELFASGLSTLARESSENDPAFGSLLFDYLASERSALAPHLSSGTRGRFSAQAALSRGEGSFGARFEWQAREFARQASDPALIAGMGVGSLISSTVRLGVLSRLAASPTAGLWTRGFGASALAGTAAWAAEVPAFWASTRLVHSAISTQPLAWDRASVLRELGSTAMLLGLLKLGGASSSALFNRVHGLEGAATGATRLSAFTRFSQPLFAQAGTFAGIYADHLLEERLGWRPRSGAWARGFDSLATLLQFHVGGRLAAEALGPRYAAMMRETELRTLSAESLARPDRDSSAGIPLLRPAMALASAGEGEAEASWASGILQMSQMKPERGRTSRGRRIQAPLDSRSQDRSPEQSELERLVAFQQSPAKALDPMLRDLYNRGQLADLALSLEGAGMRPDLGASDLARAREVLKDLEDEFWIYLDRGRQETPIADHWKAFQDWQRELAPKGMEGFLYLQQRMRSVGISDLSVIKEGEARLRNRVRDNPPVAEHFLDLAILRRFLQERGFNKVDDRNPNGIYLSHLLLNGDGNCVTLSFLFAHLASKTGRTLQLGLLPRHVYLQAGEGAAIESILDYGITSASAYRNRAIEAERKPLPAHSILSLHLLNLGKALLERGDLGDARTALLRAKDLLPRSPRADLLLAQVAQRQGDFTATLDHYRQVHAIHPDDVKGLNNLRLRAWERFQAGQYAEAEKVFLMINARFPEDIDALRALSLTYRKMNRPREAAGVDAMIDVMLMDSEEP